MRASGKAEVLKGRVLEGRPRSDGMTSQEGNSFARIVVLRTALPRSAFGRPAGEIRSRREPGQGRRPIAFHVPRMPGSGRPENRRTGKSPPLAKMETEGLK